MMNARSFPARRRPHLVAAAVALLTVLLYLPALTNGFVELDDDIYVLENTHIRSFGPAMLRWAFLGTGNYTGNWHPLTWISHAADYALWGPDPFGHHLTSILLHGVNTFLVVLLVYFLLSGGRTGTLDDRRALAAAGVVGILFGLHPLHVESVAWVSERKDLLSALFFLLSIGAYLRAADAAGPDRSLIRSRGYWPAVAFALLALLSKPMAVTLPAVLLVLDWYPLGRIASLRGLGKAVREKIPFIVLSLAVAAATVTLHREVNALASADAVTLSGRIAVAGRALVLYLAKMIWPDPLLPFYSYPADAGLFRAKYLAYLAAVGVITAACIIAARRGSRIWLAAWTTYVIMLLPVLGLLQVGSQAMADRYTYLPGLGPFLLAGIGAARLAVRPASGEGSGPAVRTVPLTVLLLTAALLSLLTVRQIGVWKSGITLWTHVLEHDPAASPIFTYNNRAIAYLRQGRLDEAYTDLTTGLAAAPGLFELRYRRGAVLLRKGDLEGAIADFSQVIAQDPSYTYAYRSRGLAYLQAGRFADAAADLDLAVARNPGDAEALNYRGILAGKLGRHDQAAAYFERALASRPEDAALYANRGLSFLLLKRYEQAIADLNEAIGRGRGGDVYLYRGMAFEGAGRRDSAAVDYENACAAGITEGCQRRERMSGGR